MATGDWSMYPHSPADSSGQSDSLGDIQSLVGHLYRRTSGQLVSTLVRIFGPDQIDLAETVVQEAFLKAWERWPYSGVPNNPGGWLTTVAKNQALDVIRRERKFADKEPQLQHWYAATDTDSRPLPSETAFEHIADLDDQLCLIFLCCHPRLPQRAQICLTLKTVGGLSVSEIARAFLSSEDATRKLITRAKQKIRDQQLPLTFPDPLELPDRLESVLLVLYLIFNEGYSMSAGATRTELCDEAIWLTSLFLHEAFGHFPKLPTVKALLALLLLQSSHLPARTDEHGSSIILAKQDRACWDHERIALGLTYLRESATGQEISTYHLQAQIAAYHATAPSYEATDWAQIVTCYDQLLELSTNPVIALNRAVAVSMQTGPEAGLQALQLLADDPRLQQYYLLPASYADVYRRLGDTATALQYYRQASTLARTPTEKHYLEQCIAVYTAE